MSELIKKTLARFLALAICINLLLIFVKEGASDEAAPDNRYTVAEVVAAGERFFGKSSKNLAKVVEKAFSSYGLPNGYVLGEEMSGSWIIGFTYGEGILHTKDMGQHELFWQGPSFGIDFGGQGSQVMILVYNIKSVNDLYYRFGGVSGAAYIIAGLGFNVLKRGDQLLVPIRTGVGARLGLNVGYLNITPQPTWNPF